MKNHDYDGASLIEGLLMNHSVVANGEAVAVGHPLSKVFKDFQAEGRTPCHALSLRGKKLEQL